MSAINLHWQLRNGNWYLVNASNQRIETVKWDADKAEYVDSYGKGLSKTFEGARLAVEKSLERKSK